MSFVIIAVLGAVLMFVEPELRKDAPNILGTIGSYATIYGVVFAIIELRRTQSAVSLAAAESKRTFERLTKLVTAREITECHGVLQAAAHSLDEGKAIPTASLLQVTKLYSQIFHVELGDPNSEHRKNKSVLESYSFNPNPKNNAPSKKTRAALISMTGQLAQHEGATKKFSE